MTIYTKVPHT